MGSSKAPLDQGVLDDVDSAWNKQQEETYYRKTVTKGLVEYPRECFHVA